MQQMLSIQLPESEIKAMISESAKQYFEELIIGKTWTLDEFRKNCCFNRERAWVTLYIFSEFADEIDYRKPGGWLRPSKGKGSAYGIFAKPACEWIEQNRDRIDWEAKMP
ncbi:phage protein [Ligilactobacillus salitolerans]|uniref:Phage protein n=1 Tax=Ligilactobacillus salitolerans TaxID=1808352 RepID=A0A401ITW8_9LACO|nr:DUF771 domain-containing protein [Ligilactobacillus salitolerans]GBG94948.1 phage protein [Ligilactobacillus salitolerans]